MCNLMKNFFHKENIAITVRNNEREGCFWKFDDVLSWQPNKPGFNLVKCDESIAFRSLITVLNILVTEKHPIYEAQKIMVDIDYSQNFRQSVAREFIANIITRSGLSINTIHISNETPFRKILGKRLMISDIIEKEQKYKFRAYVAIQKIVQREKYYIKDVSSIEHDSDFMGLSELEINSLSLYEVWSRLKTDYVCQMYGGYFLNINDNEYYNVSLFISSPIKEMINNII